MILDEAIQLYTQRAENHEYILHSGEFIGEDGKHMKQDIKRCVSENRQLAEWLMEYKDLKAEQNDQYVFIHELMSELKKAKQLLRYAIEDIYHARQGWSCSICDKPENDIDVEKRCEVDNVQPNCKYRWQYANEAEKLLNDEK